MMEKIFIEMRSGGDVAVVLVCDEVYLHSIALKDESNPLGYNFIRMIFCGWSPKN